jgi:hypothetical protein
MGRIRLSSAGQLTGANAVLLAMCEKCSELDRKIEHLNRMAQQWAPQTINAANNLIKVMEAEKALFHPSKKAGS